MKGSIIKKLVVLVAAIPSIAVSQVMVAPNKGGGEIVITARPCVVNGKTYEQFYEAYAWSPTASKAAACWTVEDGNVVLVFIADGDQRVYPKSAFKEKK